MTISVLPASDAVAQLAQFSAVIDARSEAEFAEDHWPAAVNWPTLDNAERQRIGTLYVQVSPFEARKRGAALAAANIARHIERELIDTPRHWQPLIYCWRGGKRSGALALVLDQIGFKVSLLEGGYKAFRACVMQQLPALASGLQYRVLCGPTGSGKTRLLQALAGVGAQVLDLEALACHRSSVLGQVPGQVQPGQRRFETLLWHALRGFDPARPVFVESESKKVGNLAVPGSLMTALRQSPCLDLQLPLDQRVALLLQDYDYFMADPALLCQRLASLTGLRGHVLVQAWVALVQAGQFETLVRELLCRHYDPGYTDSIGRNFSQYGQALPLSAANCSQAEFERLAQQLAAGVG